MTTIKRVLIANRGEIASRLIGFYEGLGVETVAAFSEPDAEAPYLDDADFAVYLNGRTVHETYLHPQRVVSAALDAGCDAIHPGTCFLAEHVDFYAAATNANVAIYGCDPTQIARLSDRAHVRAVAQALKLPMIPASDPLADDDTGVGAAAQLGFPLFVKSVAGGALARVESLDDVEEAVREVRKLAAGVSGDPRVYLERAVDDQRHIGVTIVADRHGNVVHLGCMDGSLEVRYHTWVEELGPEVAPDVAERIAAASVALAKALEWTGVGKARWAVTPDGGWYLLGFSARLAAGYGLVEDVHGVDLLASQKMGLEGDPIPWTQGDAVFKRHGIQVRVHHVCAEDLTRPEGTLGKLVLPEGVRCDVGVAEGLVCTPHSEPVIVKLTATAPTRQAAIVKMRKALDDLVVEGVETNLDVLRALFGDEAFWEGRYDVRTLERLREGVTCGG
jgi:acetyl-CoA carboxylase biotin carboxylase subunit